MTILTFWVAFLTGCLTVASSYDGGGTDPCQDKNGIIPNPEDCESYFICKNGTSDLIRCSDGLLFNKLKLTCDYDTSVDCDAEVPGNGTSLNRLSVPSDDVKCETDTCTCIYPSSTSCSEYYRCENGIAYKENCPGDLLLNRKKLTCDYAENVECEISTNPSTEDASSTDLTDPATVSNINTYGSTATSLKPTSSSPIEQNTVLSTSSKDSNNEEISYLTESTSETNDAATHTQPLPVESTVPTKDSNPEPGLSTETADFPPVTTSSSNPFTSTETVQLTESPSSVSIDTTVNNLSSEKPHTSELITESTSDSVETSKYSSSLTDNVATESSVASQSTKQTEDTIADVINVSQSVKSTLPDSTDFHSTTNPSIFTTISTVLSTLFVSTEDPVTEIETSTDLPTSRKNTFETESPTELPVTSEETVVADVSTDLFSTEKEPLVTETSEEFKTEKETLATEVFTDSPTTEGEIITFETSTISYTTRETPVTETGTDKKSTNEIKTDVYTTSNIAKDASEITAEPFVSDNTELTKEHTEGSVQTTKYDVSISPTTIKTPSSKIPTTVNIASTENTSVPDTTIQITEAEKSTKTHTSTTLGTSRTEPETTEDSRERRSTTVLTTQERITTTQTSSKEPINTLQTTTKGKSTTVEYATDIGSTTGFTAERNASSDTTDDLPTQGETGTTGQVSEESTTQDHKDEPEISTQTTEKHISSTIKLTTEVQTEDPTAKFSFTSYKTTEGKSSITDQTTKEVSTSTDHTMEPELSTSVGTTLKELTSETFSTPVESSTKEHDDQFDSTVETSGTITDVETTTKHTTASQITKMIPTTKSTASSTSEKTSEVESSTTHSTRSKERTTKVFLTTVESTTGNDETDRYIETSKDDTTKSQTTTTEHNIETERTTVEPPSNVSLASFGSTEGESSPSEQTTESKSSTSVGSTKNDESTTTYITSSPYDLSTEIVTDSDSLLDSSSVKYSTSSVITPINYSSSNTETFDSTTEIADISSVKPTEPPSVPSESDIASTSHADFTSSNSSTVSSVFTSVETDLTESSSVTMPLYVSTEDSYDTPSHIIVSTVVPGTSCDCEDCDVQNFVDCTRYLKCENGRYTSKQCEAGFLFSSESGRCENADEVEDCDQKSEQCSKEDGFFADEDDCSSFVQCYHGIAYRKFCSKDLFYNPVKRACDTEIKCGAEPILPTSRNLEVDCDCKHCIVGDSEDCSKYYICLNGVAYEETCSKTLVFNPDTGTCDYEYRTTCSSRSPQCTVMNGNLPVPGNCSLYYHCIAGVSYDKQCKPGYHFSVNSGKCEKACEAGCDPSLECPVTFLPICLDPSDLLPNRNDCRTFYECSEGFPKLAQCVGDEHFNPVENICQDPCEALCDPTIDCSFTSTDDVDSTEITVPISDSSVITGATKLTSVEVSSSSPNEGSSHDDSTSLTLDHSSTESDATASEIYPSSTSTSITDEFEFSTPPSYSPETSISDESSSSTESGTVSSTVDLTSSTVTNQTLTSSSLSDSTTETLISTTQESLCVEPNGVYPNPVDCRSLLLCVSGLPMKLYCEEHLHFSPITKHCEFPCNAKCDPSLDCSTTDEPDLTPLPLTFCPTKDIIPKRKSCEYYYDCTTGRRNKEKCPSGLHFNPTKRVCDVPQNAACGEPTKPLPVPDLYYKCPCESCIISSFYNCLDYFLCLNRTAYRMRCSDGLLFDRKLNTCNFAHNVICEEPTTKRPSTTTESYTTTNEPYTTRKPHTTSTPYTTSKPYTTTNNPYTTRKPYTTTSSPYTTKNPYTTRRPYTTTSTPSTTHRPYTTTRKPYVTTTTRQPYSTTRKPYVTTTTRKPYTTTRKPYVTTTTRKPYTTTRKPYESTTRKPYTTTSNKPYTTVKPTSPPKEYLCPKAIGLFRSDHNCSNFIQCSNWVPYLQHCPEGLHFNFEKQVCDYPCDAKCDKNLPCVSSTVPPPRPTPDPVCPCSNCLRPSKESCTKYYECQNGKPIKRVCLRGQTFDSIKYRCDWAHRSNCQHSEICPERNGVFPYKGDCQKFIHCANGIPHSRVCPPRLRFNPATLRCERFNGKCDAEKAPGAEKSSPQKPRFICPRNFGYFKHESNCSQFYICIKGAPLLKECPGSLLFNTKYGTCDWPENVNCRVDQSRFQKRCRYFDSRIRCPQDRAYRTHTSHCDMYYDCRTGRACTRRCPMGLYFNEKIYTCDVPSNVQCKKRDEHLYDLKELVEVCLHVHDAKMEDPGNEACYYKCHNRKVVRECCAKNRVFRMQTRRCEWKHTKMPFEFPLII
ncbi:putative chitinase 3 [Trichonephila inaurata madagascariensis]|uniref:Putative chitinase 3 n=1 Tax=Trichonephila inaurata madagascariensis TaxID=2747483 RepID=A0A8X6Y3C1_9ARAC|nr:putative chitinase 3 [Trichonephila inaurata madagascariensis]